jgi:NAD(P)H-hydrate epimerase
MLSTADVVLDAVFGTGLKLPLKGEAKGILGSVQKALQKRPVKPLVVAVDCPSGLDTDSGEVADETLACNLTVTLAAAKVGLLRFPGAAKVGSLIVADIGVSSKQQELSNVDLELATQEIVREWLPQRPKDSHKGTFGQVVVIGGSITLPGAAALAGTAAYRTGAGLVTLAVPSAIQALLAPQLPEATWILLPHDMGIVNEASVEVLVQAVSGSPVLLIGPGMGRDESASKFLRRLLGAEGGGHRGRLGFLPDAAEGSEPGLGLGPCVIDADALSLLPEIESWPARLPSETVLTPHPGEMATLTGEDKEKLQADRVSAAKKWAAEWGHVVVFKGAFTVVAAPDGRVSVLPFATSALASAGTGDVLAGTIAGFRAQGVAGYEAAVLGGYVHGLAGVQAAQMLGSEASVMAGDVISALPEAMEIVAADETDS